MNYDYVWRKLSTQSVLRTPYYGVRIDRLKHPRGHELDYYVIDFLREAAAVVPVNEQGQVLMVRQWRHPVQKLTWSIPAGAIEQGESAADAARRELREETGHDAEQIEFLYHYHPNIGVANQTFHIFAAKKLKQVARQDTGEINEVRFFSRAEIETMLDRNEIEDGMTIVGVLLWMRKS